MTNKWNKDIKLEDKLFNSVSKEMLEELVNEIPSLIKFMRKTDKSYSQIHKVRSYLIEREIATSIKEGRKTKTVLTPKGKTIVKSLIEFLEVLRANER